MNLPDGPLSELAIRTKPKPDGPLFHRITPDRSSAHLADLIHGSIPEPGRDSMWDLTERQRIAILGGRDDPDAKAKVPFAVPRAIWQSRLTLVSQPIADQELADAGSVWHDLRACGSC